MFFRGLKILCILSCITFTSFAVDKDFLFVPFDKSMDVKTEQKSTEFKELENIYNKRNPSKFRSAGWPLIPKKIHQIWLYNSAIPNDVAKRIQLWRTMYPDWEYKLWLIDDVNAFDFSTKDLFRRTKKIKNKLDILKFEILNKFGGVYVDINYIPIQNIAPLNTYYKFYAGADPLVGDSTDISISTSFLASRQNSLLLYKTIMGIREEWHKRKYYKNYTKDIFNKVVKDGLPSYRRSIVFPTSYFGVVLLDHPLISFFTKYIFFKKRGGYNKIHKETIAAKQQY